MAERHTTPLLSTPPELDVEDRAAVQEAGTNAIPYLLKWLGSYHAAQAFRLLGSNAASAIPELARLATNQPASGTPSSESALGTIRANAIAALCQIGQDAQPILSAIVTNKALGEARVEVLRAVGHGGNAELVSMTALLHCLQDSDDRIVSEALQAFRRGGHTNMALFPAVLPLLDSPNPKLRSAALEAIASFGDQSRPAILRGLRDSDDRVRAAALAELVQTSPTALTNANVLALGAEALRSDGQRQKWGAQLLRAAGQQAQGLKPDLSVRLPGGWETVLAQATNALRQLAPELLTNAPAPTRNPETPSAAQP